MTDSITGRDRPPQSVGADGPWAPPAWDGPAVTAPQRSGRHAADRTRAKPPRLKYAERERLMRRNNPLAYTGVLLGVFSVLFDVFALPGILAIVFAVLGLVRAGRLPAGTAYRGRTAAGIGIALGILTTVRFVVEVAHLLSTGSVSPVGTQGGV